MTIETTYEDLLQNVGEAFVNALADRDFVRLRTSIADDVRFRLLLPKGPQAHSGVGETVESFVRWYGDVDELHLESSRVEVVAGRLMLMYRFRLHDEDGWQLIEQHVAADASPDRLNLTVVVLSTAAQAPVLKAFAILANALTYPRADELVSAFEAAPLTSCVAFRWRIRVAIQLAAKVGHARRFWRTHPCIIARAAALNRGDGRR